LLAKVRVFLELQRQRRELQETLRLNERLIAVVSHDLRNPLNLVAVAVPVLTASSDPIVVATAQKIERSMRRMAAILSDLIDLSQARLGGGITVQPNPCELNNLAATVVDELLLVQHAAQIVVEPKADLRGLWDGQRIQQVLSNLLTNALRHGEAGTTITLVLDGTAPERVVLSVHNLGAVASEARGSLFEPFSGSSSSPSYPAYRADDPLTNQHGGLGLGLYIANQIVRAHAGTLEMESSDSGGTTFRVSLPRQF
jgi:signal transduction histidine kinase